VKEALIRGGGGGRGKELGRLGDPIAKKEGGRKDIYHQAERRKREPKLFIKKVRAHSSFLLMKRTAPPAPKREKGG